LEFERTEYVLPMRPTMLLRSIVTALIRHPRRFIAALGLAIDTGWPGLRGRLLPLAYLIEACYVADWMEKGRIEHLHNHIGEGAGCVAMMASQLTAVPFSIAFHGPHTWDRPDQFSIPEKVRHAAFVTAISSFARSQVWRWADPVDWQKVRILRCGVRDRFADRPVVPVPAAPRIVSVGRLAPEKGHAILIEAVASVLAIGIEVQLVIAGDGDQRDALEALVSRRELEGSVSFTGWLTPERVAEEISESRALVLPSFAEGLPVVLMEAFSLHRPVVATAVGAVSELVVDEESGWIVPPSSASALANAIRDVLTRTPEDLQNMGAIGARAVLERHYAPRQAALLAEIMLQAGTSSVGSRS